MHIMALTVPVAVNKDRALSECWFVIDCYVFLLSSLIIDYTYVPDHVRQGFIAH